MQEWKRGKTFAGSPIRSTKKKMKPCFVRGANASQTDRASRLHQLFWPLCFDCLCCMHKIFMLWKICSNKNWGVALPPPGTFCHVRATFHTQMKLRGEKKRKTLLLKCSALSRCSHSASFLSLSALYQPFCHGSVNAQLPAAARRAKEIDANFSLITIFH